MVDEVGGVTREQHIGLDSQLRKRKWTSGLARQPKQFDVSVAGVRNPKGRDGCTRDKGTWEDVCNKSKCGRYG